MSDANPSSIEQKDAPLHELNWQKVSPWALAYFVMHFAVRFIRDGIFNLLPIGFVFVTQVENKLFWGQIAVAIALSALLIYSFLYYKSFRFCISDQHEILLNKGVFKKERLTLKFSRVQNVNIAEPFYFIPVNLVNCIFDAAGSVSQEAVLPGVTKEYAHKMRKQILAYKAQSNEKQPDSSVVHTKMLPSNSLFISNKEIAKFGLMSNMAILALAAIAPLINVAIDFLEKQLITKMEGFYEQELGLIANAAFFAMLTLIVLLVLFAVLLSVGMSLIRFYNYQLYFKGQKFKRVAGLLERHQLSMSLDKVQSIVIRQNFVARLLTRFTVEFLQASSGGVVAGTAAKKNKQTLILPVLNSEQVDSVCQWIYPWFSSKKLAFKGAERALLYKNLVFYALIPSLLTVAFCLITEFSWFISIGVMAVLSVLVTLSYKRYGYYFHEDNKRFYLVVRKGMIGVHYRVFELYKAQSARSVSTYLMRKSSLKNVYIQLASGFAFMPYIKDQDADFIIDFTLKQVESDRRSWI